MICVFKNICPVVSFMLLMQTACSTQTNFVGSSNPDQLGQSTVITKDAKTILRDEWIQGHNSKIEKVDVLFVMDGSKSLLDDHKTKGEINYIKNAISGFVSTIVDKNIDLCTATIFASEDPLRSGQLYSYLGPDATKVTCTSQLSKKTVVSQTQQNLEVGFYGSNGEAGLYSFKEAFLNQDKLSKSKSLGFFRDDAALAVIFISDENDISTSPEPQVTCDGKTVTYAFNPPGIVDPYNLANDDCLEAAIRRQYLSDENDQLIWGHQDVHNKVQTHLNKNPFYAAVIGYLSPNKSGEVAHGYIDFVKLSGGDLVDISLATEKKQNEFNQEFVNMAINIVENPSLKNVFKLTKKACVQTIKIAVDGKNINDFTYDELAREVILNFKDAGVEGSKIIIEYQVQGEKGCE